MSQPRSPEVPARSPVPGGQRLESWKEIAVHLKHDVRTVQRWERTKGLPVRREPGGELGRVYALKVEIDGCWNNRAIHLIEEESGAPVTATGRKRKLPSISGVNYLRLAARRAGFRVRRLEF